MKKFALTGCVFVAACFFSACSDDDTVEVYECPSAYPYLSTVTHLCYKTEDDLDKAEALEAASK